MSLGCKNKVGADLKAMQASRSTWVLDVDNSELTGCTIMAKTGPRCAMKGNSFNKMKSWECAMTLHDISLKCDGLSTRGASFEHAINGQAFAMGRDGDFSARVTHKNMRWSINTQKKTFKASSTNSAQPWTMRGTLGKRLSHVSVSCNMESMRPTKYKLCDVPSTH